MLLILVILDTSHSAVGPCKYVVQLPTGDNFRHSSTAVLSSVLSRGENGLLGRSEASDLISDLDCGANNSYIRLGRSVVGSNLGR